MVVPTLAVGTSGRADPHRRQRALAVISRSGGVGVRSAVVSQIGQKEVSLWRPLHLLLRGTAAAPGFGYR